MSEVKAKGKSIACINCNVDYEGATYQDKCVT